MGYSNVAGDLNVLSITTTQDLVVRRDTLHLGNIVSTQGFATFGNVSVANLVVTGNFIITATNTQTTNSLTITNAETATALKVTQNEGGGLGHIHNVAEFYDGTLLAMVIDTEGNVGIHTSASPGYAFTVVDGALIDTLTLTTPLAVSAGGIGVTTTTQNYVFAGPQFGSGAPNFRALVNSDLPSVISVSNVSGNGSGLSSLIGSNVTGNVANATVALVVSGAAQPNITSVGLLSNLEVSNSVTTTNLFANTLTLANATSTINVIGSVTASTFYGAHAGANTGAFSNLFSANALTTTNVFVSNGLDVGPGTLGTNVVVFSNISGGSNVFVMDSNGRIGIGTTAPTFPLTVITSSSAGTGATLGVFGTSVETRIRFLDENNSTIVPPGILGHNTGYGLGIYTNYGGSPIRFFTSGQLLANERMRITDTGISILTGANPTSNLQVTGNAYISNALTTTNLFANTLTMSNATSTINVLGSVTASTFYGAHAGANTGAFSNLFSANALTTTNLFANTLTMSNATSTINVLGSVTASTFYGAHAGANTGAFSNLFSANALTTTNLFTNTLTLANATSTINVLGSVTASTFYGAHAGANTGAFSNLFSANALTTTNLFANTLTLANAAASITGNLYVSNAITTTNLFTAGITSNASNTIFNYDTLVIPFLSSTTLNVFSTANILTQTIQGSTGITSLNVTGNLFGSNALTTTNLFANTLTLANAAARITGNLFVSNALTTTNLFANTLTLANAAASITGNLYVSNAVTTTNLFANTLTLANATSTINVLGSVTATTFYGALAGANVGAFSNLFSANALTTTNLFANTLTLANAAASITGNLYVSNAVTTTNAYLSGTLNVQGTSNLATINAAVYFGDGGLLSNIPTFTQPLANLVVSNAVTTSNAYLSGTLNVQGTSNLSVANIANIYTTNIIGFIGSQWTSGTGNVYYLENVGIGTSIVSANLTVLGNIYASNAVSAPSAYFTSAYVTDSMVASTFYGTLAGANTGAFSNIYSANAVTTTNLYTAGISSNATDTTFNYDTITVPYIYVAAINASSTGNFYSMSTPTNLAVGNSISANTLTLSNATASITGNLFVSNALTTTNLFANTLTLANAAARITGNLFVSNALTTTNLFANTLTLANAAARITGNLFVSNALTTTNLFANTGTFSNNLYAAIASVGLNPSLATETFTVAGNTSFIGNVTVTSDASGNAYVLADRVPTGSLHVSSYVTGSVPLTTTTNLIQNYLSNAATIRSNTSTGTITQALYCPGTNISGVLIPNGGSSISLLNPASSNIFIEAWVNPSVVGASNYSIFARANAVPNFDFGMYISSSALVGYIFNTVGTAFLASNATTVSAGTWYHFAMSYVSSTRVLRVFTNGGLGGATGTLTGTPRFTVSSNITIGYDYNNSNFYGNVADVRVFSGGIVPTATFASPAAAPFGSTQPSYLTGTPTLLMSLNSQYFPGASTSPYGPCLTLPGTLGSYYSQSTTALNTPLNSGFTIEAWVNYASLASSNNMQASASLPFMLHKGPPTAINTDWFFGPLTTGQLCLDYYNGAGSFGLLTSGTITTGSWNHLVVQGNTAGFVNMFINGQIQTLTGQNYTPTGSGTSSASITGTVSTNQYSGISVGQYNNVQGPNFALAKARVLFGANTYTTTTFTPSPNLGAIPAGGTVAWSLDTQYPLPTYPSIQDVTPLPSQLTSYGAVPTPIGGVTSNVLGPFPGTNPQFDSIRFDGTGYIDYGNAASSVLTTNLWASNWTIEGWVYLAALPGGALYPPIISRFGIGSTGVDWAFQISPTGVLFFQTAAQQVPGPTLTVGTWYHVAATYDGARCNVYTSYNSSSVGSVTVTGADMPYVPTRNLIVGAYPSPTSYYITGNLADLRVSNVARYTGSTYTVPNVADGSAPFVTDRNTLLLLRSLAGQVGTTLEVQGRGLNAVSLGATRSVQSYPPAPMSSYLLDTTSNASVTYGQGKYIASASSESAAAWYAFDKTVGSGSTGYWGTAGSTYNTSTGYVSSAVTTVDTLGNPYAGEWLQVQLPVSLILSSYSLQARGDSFVQTPINFWVLGSRDGFNWTLVDSRVAVSWTATSQIIVFNSTSSQAWTFYRLVANRVTTGSAVASTSEWTLNGTEESLCITSDAKVGVGIANPQRALEVAGDLVVSGTISGGAGLGSFRNRIINGDMRIAQRGVGPTNISLTVAYQTIDRWGSYVPAGGVITVSQRLLTASDTPWQLGFSNSYAVTVVTGATTGLDDTPAYHNIEGYNTADFRWGSSFGQPVTLSFWFRTNLPSGSVLSVPFKNSGGTSSYISTVTTIGANTWQYATATIPPPPNGTTWLTTNGVGINMSLFYFNNTGTTFTGAPNTWLSGNYVTAAGAYNWAQNAGNYIELTGVQLEKGTVATGFEFRPFATELALCQRYYYQWSSAISGSYGAFGFGVQNGFNQLNFIVQYPVTMRSNLNSTANFSNSAMSTFQLNSGGGAPGTLNSFAFQTDASTPHTGRFVINTGSAGTAGLSIEIRANNTTAAFLGFSAEL
jgi:hypothetical protein